jgi:hypothetical protein
MFEIHLDIEIENVDPPRVMVIGNLKGIRV